MGADCISTDFYAQEITGSWKGDLDMQGMKLPLILTIKKEKDRYVSTAGSPKQSDKEIPVFRIGNDGSSVLQ